MSIVFLTNILANILKKKH